MHGESATSSPVIAVVVLTWNGRALTLDCLRSLEAVERPDVRVIVVDNGSSDGTAAAIRERHGNRVTVLETGANLGFSGGNNVGIQHALDDGAEFVLLLNNDTTVDPGFIDNLLGPLIDTPGVGITAPKILYESPHNRIWFAGGVISMWMGTARHIGIRETDVGQYDKPRSIDYASGCALLARRDVFERAGLLDTSYHAYFEDVDLCVRARHSGFDIVYIPAAKVWHKISASTGGQLSRRKISRKLRSALRFFGHHARWYHWLTIPLFFLVDVVRIVFLVLAGRIRDSGGHTPQSTP
jgi:GT2 family glycosyltransferase